MLTEQRSSHCWHQTLPTSALHQGAQVWKLIDERNANVYICGDANHMEKDVMAALLEIFQQHGSAKDAAEAQAYMDKLSSTKRLQKDTWF